MASVEKSVLRRIKPGQSETDDVHKFLGRLEDETRKSGFEGVAAGSIGKHTWLAGDHDIDWFVLLPKGTSREQLESTGLDIGRKLAKALHGKPQVKYAEHPYTRVLLRKYFIDVVPCYKIVQGERVLSAVDRSPLHLAYVCRALPAERQDEVRLLKQFMKGAGVYGSDARHEGFSGYIAELLVIRHGSFANVVKQAAEWKLPVHIMIEAKQQISKELKAPLVLIDPVDPDRNVAAALSAENLLRFVAACRSYLEKPSPQYFFPKPKPLSAAEIKRLQQRGTHWLAFAAKKPDIIDDTLWPQMRRAVARISSIFTENEFVVVSSGVFANRGMILFFELENQQLPPVKRMEGPPVFVQKHSQEFLAKYANASFGPYVEGDKWVVHKRREMQLARDIAKIAKMPAEKMQELGVPSHVAGALKKCMIAEQKAFWGIVRREHEFSRYMRKKYFEPVRV